MIQTTIKKGKAKVTADPKLEQALYELESHYNLGKSTSDEEFFIKNMAALIELFSILFNRGLKELDWKEIYLANLKVCINLKRVSYYQFSMRPFFVTSKQSNHFGDAITIV